MRTQAQVNKRRHPLAHTGTHIYKPIRPLSYTHANTHTPHYSLKHFRIALSVSVITLPLLSRFGTSCALTLRAPECWISKSCAEGRRHHCTAVLRNPRHKFTKDQARQVPFGSCNLSLVPLGMCHCSTMGSEGDARGGMPWLRMRFWRQRRS